MKNTKKPPIPEHAPCKDYWCEKYTRRTGNIYFWDGAAAKALNDIISKLKTAAPDTDTIMLFKKLVDNMPQWYLNNSYILTTVNKCFNAITAKIKQDGNGKQQTGVSNNYLAETMRKANGK